MSNKPRSWFFGLEDAEGAVNENAPQIETEVAPVETGTGEEVPMTENTGVKTDTSDVQTTQQQEIVAPAKPDEDQPAVEDLEVPSETVEARLVEFEGLDREIGDMLADGGQMVADTENMERITDEVAASGSEGGLTEVGARVANIATEHYCERWGIDRVVVASESFSTPGARMNATRVATESMVSVVAGGWDKFVAWLKALLTKLKAAFVHYTGIGKTLVSRGERLKARLAKGLGSRKDGEISGAWASKVSINGKIDPAAVVSTLEGIESQANTGAKAILTHIDAASKGTPSQALGLQLGVASQNKAALAAAGASGAKVSALPGNNYLISFTRDGKANIEFRNLPSKADGKVPTPDIATMQKAVEAILSAGSALEGQKMESLNKLVTAIEGLSNKPVIGGAALKSAVKSGSNEQVQGARTGMEQARAAVLAASNYVRAVTTSIRDGAVGLTGYVTAGIGAYAGSSKEKSTAVATV